jgi:TolB-like protein/AraC-like DNA-binding protein
VLPFQNLSSDKENEYFADGMTDEIINALSKIEGLKVTARTSSFVFKDKKEDVRIIGNQLGVETVIEGSIRKSGKRIRISTQLVRTDNGFQLWSETFDRQLENIFELQDEVSLLIAEQIRENYGHLSIQEKLVIKETSNLEAYEAYLKGRYHQLKWDEKSFHEAIKWYKKSITLDNNYPMPYLAISQCYVYMASWCFIPQQEGYILANDYFQKIEAKDENLAEFNFASATKSLWMEWNFNKAYKELKAALSIYTNYADALEAQTELYTAIGDFESAHQSIDQAIEVNPLSPNHLYSKGNIYFLTKKYKKALICFEKSLNLDSNWMLSFQLKLVCYIILNQQKEFRANLESLDSKVERQRFLWLNSQINQGEHIDFIDSEENSYLPWDVYFPLFSKKIDKALSSLEIGIKKRKGQYIGFKNDPILSGLFENKKYQELVFTTFGVTEYFSESKTARRKEDVSKLSEEEITTYKKELIQVVQHEKVYLDSSLSLKTLAEKINLHPNKLSWLLNDQLCKNFNEYINGYRIKAFQEKALADQESNFTLLGLAYDSGFNSKSVFNDSFKKSTGLTPKQWLKKNT